MRIGDAQYESAPAIGTLPGYRDPADPCGYGLTLYKGAVCVPDDSPVLAEAVGSRIVDWKALDGVNWGVVIAALLAGYVLIQKARGK